MNTPVALNRDFALLLSVNEKPFTLIYVPFLHRRRFLSTAITGAF